MAIAVDSRSAELTFHSEGQTADFAARLGLILEAGDTVLLTGEIGSGKSVFARAAIQSMMASKGELEDVPSPTFTLVQTYDIGSTEVWHCDLYRLGDASEIGELGLEGAFESAVVFVEWADRLGEDTPADALSISLCATSKPGERCARLNWSQPRWTRYLESARQAAG